MRIPVAFICDDNFVMQTSVAITSMMKNKSKDTEYIIYVIMAECSPESETNLKKTADVKIIRAGLERFEGIKQLAHISPACLLKFFLCELIPCEEKILYLDGDIIVRDDLTPLFKTELCENYAAAIPLGIDYGKFNAGVMLFNGEKMRSDHMAEKLLDFRKRIGNAYSMDQQTFNNMIADHVVRFPARYNCVPFRIKESVREKSLDALNAQNGTSYKSVKELLNDAGIVHFASRTKPWECTFLDFSKEWFNYYLQSPYGDVPLHRQNKIVFTLKNLRRTSVWTFAREKIGLMRKKNAGQRIRDQWDKTV